MNKPNTEFTIKDVVILLKKLSNYTNEEEQISTAADIYNNTDYYKCKAIYSYSLNKKDIFYLETITKNKPHSIVICAYLKLLKLFAKNNSNCEMLTESEYIDIYEALFKYHFMDKYDIYIYLAKLFKRIFKKNSKCIYSIIKSNYILSRMCNIISDNERNATEEQQISFLKLIQLLITNYKYKEIFGYSGIIEILCNDIVRNLAVKIEEMVKAENEESDEDDNYNNNQNENSNKNSKSNNNISPEKNNSSRNNTNSSAKLNKSNTIEKKGNEKSKKNKKVTLKENKTKSKDKSSKKDIASSFKLNLNATSKNLLNEMCSIDTLRSLSTYNNEYGMAYLDYNNSNDIMTELRLDILQNICCMNDTFRHDAITQNIISIINVIIKKCFYPLNEKSFFILSNLIISQDVSNVETLQAYLLSNLQLLLNYVTNECLYLSISFLIRNIIYNFGSIKSKFYTYHGIDYMYEGIKACINRLNNFDSIPENDFSLFYAVDNYTSVLKNVYLSSKAHTIKEALLKYSKSLVDILNLILSYYYEYLNKVVIIPPENNKKKDLKDFSTFKIENNKLYIYNTSGTNIFQYSKDDYEINVKDKFIEKSNDPFKMIIDNVLNLFILITNYDNTSKFFYESGSLNEILIITKKFIENSKEFDLIEKLLNCIENMSLYLDSSQKIFECMGSILIEYIYKQKTLDIKLRSLCIMYNIITTNVNLSSFIFSLPSGFIEEVIAAIASVNNDFRDISIKIVNFFVSQNNQEINAKLFKHGCIEELSVVINHTDKNLITPSILNMATSSYLKLIEANTTNPEFCIKMQSEWKQRDIYFKPKKDKSNDQDNIAANQNQKKSKQKQTKKSLKKTVKKVIKAKKFTKLASNKVAPK